MLAVRDGRLPPEGGRLLLVIHGRHRGSAATKPAKGEKVDPNAATVKRYCGLPGT